MISILKNTSQGAAAKAYQHFVSLYIFPIFSHQSEVRKMFVIKKILKSSTNTRIECTPGQSKLLMIHDCGSIEQENTR